MSLGEKIRELRKRHRLSQDELGKKITIHGRLILDLVLRKKGSVGRVVDLGDPGDPEVEVAADEELP